MKIQDFQKDLSSMKEKVNYYEKSYWRNSFEILWDKIQYESWDSYCFLGELFKQNGCIFYPSNHYQSCFQRNLFITWSLHDRKNEK